MWLGRGDTLPPGNMFFLYEFFGAFGDAQETLMHIIQKKNFRIFYFTYIKNNNLAVYPSD